MSDVSLSLAQLGKPLVYAVRHNFAHLGQLRDLEPYIHHHVQTLQSLSLPPALPPLLQQLAQAAQGFDTLPLSDKQARVMQLCHLLAQMRAALASAAAPSSAPPQPPLPVGDP